MLVEDVTDGANAPAQTLMTIPMYWESLDSLSQKKKKDVVYSQLCVSLMCMLVQYQRKPEEGTVPFGVTGSCELATQHGCDSCP